MVSQLTAGKTSSIPRVFISSDGGASFAQRIYPDQDVLNQPWLAFAFAGAGGIEVQGAGYQKVFFTRDAAVSWTRSTVNWTNLDESRIEYGTPVLTDHVAYLPSRSCNPGTSTCTFALLTSKDSGATFTVVPGSELDQNFGEAAAKPIHASYADGVWWLIEPSKKLRTWSEGAHEWTVVSSDLPANIVGFTSQDRSHASILVSEHQCSGTKSDCTSAAHLLQTSDGGRTWASP